MNAPWQKKFPYIIAEAGVNHNGSLELALGLVEAAKGAGADCVKFQAFTASELVTRAAAKAEYQKAAGKAGEGQFEMLRRLELSPEQFGRILEHCRKQGIDFLITPFSVRWVEVLQKLGVAAWKIGSGNLQTFGLLEAIGATGRPVILSTGMSRMEEVQAAIAILKNNGCGDLAILQCVSTYPTPLAKANLAGIGTLQRATGLPAGYSDHTREVFTGGLAVAAGAALLEKHFTLDKGLEGPDHAMSLTPGELKEYGARARQAAAALGDGQKQVTPEEEPIRAIARTSVVAACFILKGMKLTREMLTAKRPGTGIPGDRLAEVAGRVALRDIRQDEILRLDDLGQFLT